MQAFVQVVINDAEREEEPPRPQCVTEGTTGTIFSEEVPIHVNDLNQ